VSETSDDNAPDAETELLLSALRSAVIRAKLDANQFETIGIALRNRFVSPEGALAWLEDAGLIGQVIPEGHR
jgi:hypothetical protein